MGNYTDDVFCLQIRTDAQKELEMEEVRREASTQGKLAGHAGLRHEMELLERERDAALAEVAAQRMEVKTKTELVQEANGKHAAALEITEDFKLRLRQAQARVKELEAGWGEREAASIKSTARISADGDAPDVEAVDRSVDRSVDQSPMSPPRSAYKDVQALRETHAWRHEGADPGADLGAEVNIESVEQAAEIIRADRAALRMERSLRAAGEKRLALVEGNAPESAVLAVLKEAQEDKASAEERASKAEYAAAAAAARENEARGRLTKLVDDAYGLTPSGEKPNPEDSNRTDEDAEPGAENGHKNGHDASPDDADEPFVPAVKPIADNKKMMTRLYHRLEHSGSPTPSEKDELRAESIERKKKLGEWTPADDVDERWRCESEELNKMSADALRRRCVELELTTEEARRMAHDAEMRAELATQRALKAERRLVDITKKCDQSQRALNEVKAAADAGLHTLREELVRMREAYADDAAYARRETAQTVDSIRMRFQDEVKVLRTRAEAEARALRKEASDAVETATGLRTRLRACQEELAGRSQTGAKK